MLLGEGEGGGGGAKSYYSEKARSSINHSLWYHGRKRICNIKVKLLSGLLLFHLHEILLSFKKYNTCGAAISVCVYVCVCFVHLSTEFKLAEIHQVKCGRKCA